MTETAALKFNGVTKRFRRRIALDGLDLDVPRGCVLGLVGSNGAGKTTTMSLTCGLLSPTAGTIDVLGDGPFAPRSHSGRVSLMPQDSDIPPTARVMDILLYYARLQGLSSSDARTHVHKALDLIHLADRANSIVRTLSHGMRRRLVIAQVFLGNPELVLMDEPMSGLDPVEVARVRDFLRSRRGAETIVISSHNLHEIALICDEVAFIEDGKTVRQDSLDTLTEREYVIRYRLAAGSLELNALQTQAPETEIVASEDHSLVTVKCLGDESRAAEVNRVVLAALLAQNADILEVQRGQDLETTYLARAKNAAPDTRALPR
jgi:ABC-2 type transport system ATP-binding protein